MGYRVVQTPKPWYETIPIIGGHFAKIGQTIDLYADPCSPTAGVWVYGFFQAIPTLAASLLKPELIDINIEHRHGKPRKGKKFKFDASIIFRDAIIEIPVPRWVFFRIYEMSQRIGWYFLVADASEDFAINWMTAAYKYQGCSSPLLAYCHRSSNMVLAGPSTANVPRGFVWATDGVSNVSITAATMQPVFPGKYRCTWSVTFSPWSVPAQSELPYTTYATLDGVPADVGEISLFGDGNAYASGSIIVDIYSPGTPVIAIVCVWNSSSKFCYMTGQWNLDLIDKTALGPDP